MDDSHLRKNSKELEAEKETFSEEVLDDWELYDDSDWDDALEKLDLIVVSNSDSSDETPDPIAIVLPELTLDDRMKLAGIPKSARRVLVNQEAIAEIFIEHYDSTKNPCVSLEVLVELKTHGCLGIEAHNYNPRNKMIAGDMIFTFYFFTEGAMKTFLGEFHVHWNRPKDPRGEAGTPGWKKGRRGKKVIISDLTTFRALIGTFWGRDKSTGGRPTKL